MLLTSLICRFLVCAGLVCTTLRAAQAQSGSAPDAPKLTEDFTFRLNQRRDDAIRRTIETMRAGEEMQRMLDLRAAEVSVFTRVIDLFRFVPVKLSSSDSKNDDFLTPNYLRADYRSLSPPETHLFDQP